MALSGVPQLMAHRGEEARLGEVLAFCGATPRLSDIDFAVSGFGDQRVLFRAQKERKVSEARFICPGRYGEEGKR